MLRPSGSELRYDGWRSPDYPTNNQSGQRSGPCRRWGLDKARHIVPTALLVRVQCFRKGMYNAVEGPRTRPIVLSMITGSYCRRRRRLTIFELDEMKFGVSLWRFEQGWSLISGSGADRVVKILACGARGPGFESESRPLNYRDWVSPASKPRYTVKQLLFAWPYFRETNTAYMCARLYIRDLSYLIL